MSRLLRVPAHLPDPEGDPGGTLPVRRVWPVHDAPDSASSGVDLVVELTDAAGRVRAGRVRLHLEREPASSDVRVQPYGLDPRLGALEEAARGGRVVGHRLGKRAVVATGDAFVKVVRETASDRVLAAARQAQELGRLPRLITPRVVGHGPGTLRLSVLPGRSAHELGGDLDAGSWTRCWQAWRTAWVGMVGEHGLAPDGLPTHTAVDEAGVLEQWARRAVSHHVLPGPQVEHRLRAVVTALTDDRSGPRPMTLAHRDLHDKQVFFDGDSRDVGLLDFDTLTRAEPALDLANLAVHAGVRRRQGLWCPEHAATVVAAVRDAAADLSVDPHRFATYARATTLRLACLYAFRPPWQDLAAALLSEPDDVLATT